MHTHALDQYSRDNQMLLLSIMLERNDRREGEWDSAKESKMESCTIKLQAREGARAGWTLTPILVADSRARGYISFCPR
jgi:hypothetical protein